MNKTVIAVNLKSANWISYIQSLSFQVCTFLLNYLGVKSNNEDSFFYLFCFRSVDFQLCCYLLEMLSCTTLNLLSKEMLE